MLSKETSVDMPYALQRVNISLHIHPYLRNWQNDPNFKLLWRDFETMLDEHYAFDIYGVRIVPLNVINDWIDTYFHDPVYEDVRAVLKDRFAKLTRAHLQQAQATKLNLKG